VAFFDGGSQLKPKAFGRDTSTACHSLCPRLTRRAIANYQRTLKHALVQDAVYGTLLRSRRQQIHARTVAILEGHFPEIATEQPQLMAQHSAEVELKAKAVNYWLQVGQQALAALRDDGSGRPVAQGVGHPRRPARRPLAPATRTGSVIALAPALAATKGYSATDVGETIARVRVLAEQIDRPEHLVPQIYGQWAFHLLGAESRQMPTRLARIPR
jgi:hypothetical protein